MKLLCIKNKNIILSVSHFIFVLLLAPQHLLFAQSKPSDFSGLVQNIINIIDPLVVLAIVLAVMFFLFAVVKYLTQYGNEKARSDSVKTITWGIVGLFAMVAMWGLVKLIQQSLVGGSGTGIPQF
jgi:hypothetical protein